MTNSSRNVACYTHKESQDGFDVFRINIEFVYDYEWDDFFCIPAQAKGKKVAHFTKGGIAFYNITPEEQRRIVHYACENELCDKKICKDFVPC